MKNPFDQESKGLSQHATKDTYRQLAPDRIPHFPVSFIIEDLSGTSLLIDVFDIALEFGGFLLVLPDVPAKPENQSQYGQKSFRSNEGIDRTECIKIEPVIN
jgi:hypothetical protein